MKIMQEKSFNAAYKCNVLLSFRHANLILNLFSLMVDANVPDIALEPDKTVKKVSMHLDFKRSYSFQINSNCPPTPPLTQQQSLVNKLVLMLG